MMALSVIVMFSGQAAGAYATAGTLKPSHAVMMHGILVLPILAWLMRLTAWTEPSQRRIVLVAVAGYALCAGVVTIELSH